MMRTRAVDRHKAQDYLKRFISAANYEVSNSILNQATFSNNKYPENSEISSRH